MLQILDGKTAAAALSARLKERAEKLIERGVIPCLAIVRMGDRPDDIAYERGAKKRCAAVGVETRSCILPENAPQDELIAAIENINGDASVHGCLIFMPLPKHIDERAVRAALAPEKDADGITPVSQASVYSGGGIGYPPCTPSACVEILRHYGVPMRGANAVILGRSLVVGRPLAMLLLRENATVTVCHTSTKDTPSIAQKADILLAAVGRAGTVTADFTHGEQTIVDVGINVGPDGHLCGDVSPEAAARCAAYTPVPGGVGAVTTTILAQHVIDAAEKTL